MVLSLDILSSPRTGRTFVVGLQDTTPPRWMLIGAGGSPRAGDLLISRLDQLAPSSYSDALFVDRAVVTAPDEARGGGLITLADECRERREVLGGRIFGIGEIWHNWPPELDADVGEALIGRACAAITETSVLPWVPHIDLPYGRALREAFMGEAWRARPAHTGREPLPAPWKGTMAVLAPSAASTVADVDADRGISALHRLYELLSIAVLIETPAGRLLFSGGASAADILAGLDQLEVTFTDVLTVDVIEVPQSGNTRRLDPDFFRRIRSDHYIFPSPHSPGDSFAAETILASRDDDDFTVWPPDTGHDYNSVAEVLSERAALGGRSFTIEKPGGRLVLQGNGD